MRSSRNIANRIATLVACAALCIGSVTVQRATAQPTLSRGASIVFLPRVVLDAGRDTVIEIANTSNSQVSVLCLYLDGSTGLEVNFDLRLTRQNSTRWNASEGLLCPDGGPECNFGPGLVPPLPLPFEGALVCIEVDATGAPLAGNHLAMTATILDLATDVESHGAIGLPGSDNLNDDATLCLGGSPISDDCPIGTEYAGCPDEWILNHAAEGGEDPIAGTGSSVSTTLTFVNCGQDFEMATAPAVPLELTITNELEQTFSASTTIASWAEASLEEINAAFRVETLGTTYAQTRIRAVEGGVAIVARELRRAPGQTAAAAAFPLVHNGISGNSQAIVLHPSLIGQ